MRCFLTLVVAGLFLNAGCALFSDTHASDKAKDGETIPPGCSKPLPPLPPRPQGFPNAGILP